MKKTKKMLALALAASMVLGNAVVAFAEDTTPGGTGTTQGAGTVEGHVNKEVLNVVLPTVTAGSSAFAYTIDPERLISGTTAAKYEGATFPSSNDTGVYFLTGTNTYANTSNAYQVINKSSCDVTLTVKAKATQNTANDIALASSSTVATTGTPNLYLGLKVGKGADTAISTTEATVTKTLAGTPTNFNIKVVTDQNGEKTYAYAEKADATTWKAINISLTGAVSNLDIAADTTAPTVDVTWSWAKAADGATVDTSDQEDYTVQPPQMTVSTAGLITISNLTAEKNYVSLTIMNSNGGPYHVNEAPCTWNEDNYSATDGGSLTCQLGDVWLGTLRGITTGKAILTLSDGTTLEVATNIPAATE